MEENNANGIRELVRMASTQEVLVSVIDAIMVEDDLFQKMLGKGGCWFAFDVLFYGDVLFQPIILGAAFGAAETIQKTAMDTLIVSALSLPGYFQAQGFLMMGILFVRREVSSCPDSSSFWQLHELQRLTECLTRCPGSSYHD
jgi:hypothetical protein